MAKGRSYSRVRTPVLIRDYLSGEAFPGAEEGVSEAIQPARGDYLSSIHRHLKRRIKELDPRYHWPRYPSFVTMLGHLKKLGLVEPTGETETRDILIIHGDPDAGTAPGDLRLDPVRGFQERHYYRLVPGAGADPAWGNPMEAIRAIYGIELAVAVPRPPPRPAPVVAEEPPPVKPAPRRPGRPRGRPAPEEPPPPASPALQEAHQQLNVRRAGLHTQAQTAAGPGGTPDRFVALEQDVSDFIALMRLQYRVFPRPSLVDDLGTLTGCNEAYARAESGGQKGRALASCHTAAEVIADDLRAPLPMPDIDTGEFGGEEEPVEGGEVTEEARGQVAQRWSVLVDRISGWSRPNSTNAANLMDKFVEEVATDESLGIEETDLDDLIAPAREGLTAYQEIERSDFDNAEECQEARADAWGEFVEALDVDFSELGEGW